MRQLTSLDAQFLGMETARTYGHVSGLAIYDPSTAPGGTLTVKDMCRTITERLHLLPPFRWKLVEVPFDLDLPYWAEDPDFDIDFHVRDSAVPPPGDKRQLAEVVSRIVARPLDRGRPLWEVYVIHGVENGKYVAVLTKIHHSVVDGVSGAEVLATLLDVSPEGRELPPKGDLSGDRVPGQLEMLGRGALALPRQPLRALRALPKTVATLPDIPTVSSAVPGMGAVGKATAGLRRRLIGTDSAVLGTAPTTVPRTRFNTPVSAHRRFAFDSVPLDTVKAIKNELGITVNDVVVALCATAVREWLLERDELPDDPLVAMVPVSVRTDDQIGTYGNRVSAMIVPIPTDEPDPRKRLMRTHEILDAAKSRHNALPADILQDATRFIPPAVLALAARTTMQIAGTVRPILNLVVSNVPGPRMPLYCAGAELVAMYPVSVITDGVGLNITCQSYLDHIDFGVIADHDQVDEAWSIMDALRGSLDDLHESLCGTGLETRMRTLTPVS